MNNYEYQKTLLEKRIDAAYDAVIAAGHKNINVLTSGEKILQLTLINQELKSFYDKNHSSVSLTENGVTFTTDRKLSFTYDSLKTFFMGVDAGLAGFECLQDYFIRPSSQQIRKGLESGVSFDDIQKGFHAASSAEVSEIPSGAMVIRKCDAMGVFENDDDAVRQARLEGTDFIRSTDLSFTYDKEEDPRCYYRYIDCPENRVALSDFFLSDIQMNNISTLNSILYEVEDWVAENFAHEQQVMTSELYPELKDRLLSKNELTDRLLATAFSHPYQNLEYTKEYLIRHCQQPGRALKAAAEHFYPECELFSVLDELDQSQLATVLNDSGLKKDILSTVAKSFFDGAGLPVYPLLRLAERLEMLPEAVEMVRVSGISLSERNREAFEHYVSSLKGTHYTYPDDCLAAFMNIGSDEKVTHAPVAFFKNAVCRYAAAEDDVITAGQQAVNYCQKRVSDNGMEEIAIFIKTRLERSLDTGLSGKDAYREVISGIVNEGKQRAAGKDTISR